MSTTSLNTALTYKCNLGRSKACEACRHRKLKCDGIRPSCTPCQLAWKRMDRRSLRSGRSADRPPCIYRTSDHAKDAQKSTSSSTRDLNGKVRYDDTAQASATFASSMSMSRPSTDVPLPYQDVELPEGPQLEEMVHIFFNRFATLALFQPDRLCQRIYVGLDHPEGLHESGESP